MVNKKRNKNIIFTIFIIVIVIIFSFKNKDKIKNIKPNNHTTEIITNKYFIPNNLNFDFLDVYYKNKYIYHYISFIYINNEDNILSFSIDSYVIDNIFITFVNGNRILTKRLSDLRDIDIIYQVSKEKNHFEIRLNQFDGICYIYFTICNNYKQFQYIPNDNKIFSIKNFSKQYFLLRDINDNVIFNKSKSLINLGNSFFLDKKFYKENDTDILFHSREEKDMYLYDRFILTKIFINEGIYLNYNDSFEISYKLAKGCNLIIFAVNDWCNTAYRYMKSLERKGIYSILIKTYRHKFNYKYQGIIPINFFKNTTSKYPVIQNIDSIEFIKNITHNVDNIWFHATSIYSFKNKTINEYLSDKNYFVAHGGTTYRREPEKAKQKFNFVNKSLIQCPDLLDLNTQEEKLIYYPLDYKIIEPNLDFKSNKLVFGHFPSTGSVKGTPLIESVIEEFKNQITYIGDEKKVSWEDQIKRYKECDVYIETINPSLDGHRYGEWGNTCLEASACGCIVITNCLHLDKYIKYYENVPAIFVANNREELKYQIKRILSMSNDQILNYKKKSIEWVKNYHSFEICGERIINYFNLKNKV